MSGAKGRRADATERVLRLIRLLEHLGASTSVAVKRLTELCECSRSNLYRDLHALEFAGFVESVKHGYWGLTERGRAFPAVELSAEDALSLALARAFLDRPGLPHGARIQNALARVTAAALPAGLRRLADQAGGAIAVEPRVPDIPIAEPIFDTLLRAVTERRTVAVDYDSAHSGRGVRRLDPYGIAFEGDRGYLHAWYHRNRRLQTFRLDRVLAVTVADERFERDEAAWLAFRGQTGVFQGLRGGPPVAVRVRFSPDVRRYALEPGRWPEGWTAETEPDGSVLLTGTARGTDGILVELLRWRRHARVLGGPELLAEYRQEIAAMAAQCDAEIPAEKS